MAVNKVKTYKIASIPGDDIGPEVVNVIIDVLKSLQEILSTYRLEFTELDWGTARYKRTGKYMPADGLSTLKTFHAGIFGAVGAPGMKFCIRRLDFGVRRTFINHMY
ncbi:hypothetical protein EYB25_005141 [Talaromyces marneffei]|uniref:Isopropylmalate dehydrogenase-like domain-containing protein n=1 Tax=Talaromyces marneffei (strain ATCC 18224 / CBS 334.59 / QM 7333) TaxID=441960 RepID=B6QD56_TALMQ|nr:hypothetical protein PMAA_077390 [Talaromyces marneffei ATCC 18224]KAE8553759.1 hypothetical protein EYB25_005141 [Talaromyces marneffei]